VQPAARGRNVMEIFERYIREVTRYLPRGHREDVAKELRSTLEDSLEGRLEGGAGEPAASSGREAVATEILLDFGPPRAFAASYRGGPRYLIGPDFYPGFMSTLKFTLLVVCGLQLAVGLFDVGRPSAGIGRIGLKLLDLLGDLQGTALSLLGLIVLIFALIQHFSSGESASAEEWNPADLPPLKDPDRIDHTGEALGLVFICLGLLIFNFFPEKLGASVSVNGERTFVPLLGPDYQLYLPWWNLYLIGGALLILALLARTHWRAWHRWVDLALAVLLVGILWWMVGSESILQPQVGGQAAGGSATSAVEALEKSVMPVLRVVFRVGLWIWLVGAAFSALSKSYKLVRRLAGS
jgi:hypothetical protein